LESFFGPVKTTVSTTGPKRKDGPGGKAAPGPKKGKLGGVGKKK
jgi:hypothetical protein